MEAKLGSKPNVSRKINRDEVINAAKSFEPLSPTIVRLSSMLVDTNIDLSEIISLISYDQALTYQLLKSANSAYVGSASRITNVQEVAYFRGNSKRSSSSLHAPLAASCAIPNYLHMKN